MYSIEVLECSLYDIKDTENSRRRVAYIKDLLNLINKEIKEKENNYDNIH